MQYKIEGRLTGQTLHVADIRDSIKRDAAKMGRAVLHAVKMGADIRFANLRGVDLRGADLRGAKLASVDLSGARLERADLRDADLSCATLTRARLRGADLRGAYLEGAALFEADLQEADARGADLRGADLRDACINRGKIAGACFDGADVRSFSAWEMGVPYKDIKPLFDRSIREVHQCYGDCKIRNERARTWRHYVEERAIDRLPPDIKLERVRMCSANEAGTFPSNWERLATVKLAEDTDEDESDSSDICPVGVLQRWRSKFGGRF